VPSAPHIRRPRRARRRPRTRQAISATSRSITATADGAQGRQSIDCAKGSGVAVYRPVDACVEEGCRRLAKSLHHRSTESSRSSGLARVPTTRSWVDALRVLSSVTLRTARDGGMSS
jgi:hypothetical protein